MQSTHIREKRGSTRREWVAPLRLEEIRTGRKIEAQSANCSSAGIMVELNQPLWPGMELALVSGTESAASRVEMRRLDVRWCRMVPGGSGSSTYIAGLRFDGPVRRMRNAGNLKVIHGGAAWARSPWKAIAHQRHPDGRSTERRAGPSKQMPSGWLFF